MDKSLALSKTVLSKEEKLKQLSAIEYEPLKLTPFLRYYMDLMIENDDFDDPIEMYLDTSLTTSTLFQEIFQAIKFDDVIKPIQLDDANKIVTIQVYEEILKLLEHHTSPLTLLKASILMYYDLEVIKAVLRENSSNSLWPNTKKRFYLYFGLLYLELFSSRTTSKHLEPFFERNQEHPYILEVNGGEYASDFSKFITIVYQALKDFQGVSDSLQSIFDLIRYDENVILIDKKALAYAEHFQNVNLENGQSITPSDYYLQKRNTLQFSSFVQETFQSIRYINKALIEKDTHFIMSPIIKAIIQTDLAPDDQVLANKYEITYIKSISASNVPFEKAELAPHRAIIYQIGNRYFIQRAYTENSCRYCMYIYPLSPYSMNHIKDIDHPTQSELNQLFEKIRSIFDMGGI